MSYQYIFSGVLPEDTPTYIKRKADEELYQRLKAEQFCYVFNSRKTGKSSLRVRVMNRLIEEKFTCVVIDLSLDDVQLATPNQWYFSILHNLNEDLELDFDLHSWWNKQNLLSSLGKVRKFFETILLKKIKTKIVIFIDEIDSILSLPFPTDDFFAFIRGCYNLRADRPEYYRLTFCLLGVATPSILIKDKQRTPFNIGYGIELKGFTLIEANPLATGLIDKVVSPKQILEEIWYWTRGQPFLMQKLLYLVTHSSTANPNVNKLVKQQVINNWEEQDEPEHLKTIRDRLLYQEKKQARLLGWYQQILQQGEVKIDGSDEQIELRLSGIVIKEQDKLRIYNPLYQQIFNLSWIERQLAALRPYTEAIAAWLAADGQDSSRLLRGKALQEAQFWGKTKHLSTQDYDFLAASEQLAKQELQQTLLAERTEKTEAKLFQERKIAKIQRLWLFTLAMALLTTSAIGLVAFRQYRRASINELKATAESSEAFFSAEQKLDALIATIKAKEQLKKLGEVQPQLSNQINQILEQTIYSIKEFNRITENEHLSEVAIAADGNLMAIAEADKTIQLWQPRGDGWKKVKSLKAHTGEVMDVAISGNGRIIASASNDRTIKLWRRDGTLLTTLRGHKLLVNTVALNWDGSLVVSGGEDRTIKVWQQGKPLRTLTGHTNNIHSVAIAHNKEFIVSGGDDRTIKIWQQGKLLRTLTGHQDSVRSVVISPDDQLIVSASRDRTIKIWNFAGQQIATLKNHTAPVYSIAISPDGQKIISASGDKTIKIWSITGTEIGTLKGHVDRVWDIAYSPKGDWLASVGWDNTVRFWRPYNNLVRVLSGHQDVAIAVAMGTNFLASASDDHTVKLWQPNGELINTFRGHTAEVYDVAIHPYQPLIASAGGDKTIQLWRSDGKILATLKGHNATIRAVGISPDGKQIISGGDDNTIKLWNLQGKLLQTLTSHSRKVWDVAISRNNQWFTSASEDNTIKLWQLNGTLLHTLRGHQDAVRTVAISPDSQWLASGSEDSTIKIWSRNGKLMHTLKPPQATTIKGIAISPDGKWLASASDNSTINFTSPQSITLWHYHNQHWQLIRTLRGNNSSIWSVAFSPDGKWLASAGEDYKVKLWNLAAIKTLNPTKYACHWLKGYLQQNQTAFCQNHLF
jgi:WD40 repeat protein